MKYSDKIRWACDLDDTLFDFIGSFTGRFDVVDWENSRDVAEKVYALKLDRSFWSRLPLLERPKGWEPTIYATKRINSKKYTRECLEFHRLPVKPIYQIYSQNDNKARIIKGRCDCLIDDSAFNCYQAIHSGLPALLISRPHNVKDDFKFRINSLDIDEMMEMFIKEIRFFKEAWGTITY